jgi:hypothetical protein
METRMFRLTRGDEMDWMKWALWKYDYDSRVYARLIGVRRGAFIVKYGNGEIVEYDSKHAWRVRHELAAAGRRGLVVSVSEYHGVLALPEREDPLGDTRQPVFLIRVPREEPEPDEEKPA